MTPRVIHAVVALVCGLAFAAGTVNTGLQEAMKLTLVGKGTIYALGLDADGPTLVRVPPSGELPKDALDDDFSFTPEQLSSLETQISPEISVVVRVLENHRSRNSQTIQLWVSAPQQLLISVYEGTKGAVIPSLRGEVERSEFRTILLKGGAVGLVVAVVVFLLLSWAWRSHERRKFSQG